MVRWEGRGTRPQTRGWNGTALFRVIFPAGTDYPLVQVFGLCVLSMTVTSDFQVQRSPRETQTSPFPVRFLSELNLVRAVPFPSFKCSVHHDNAYLAYTCSKLTLSAKCQISSRCRLPVAELQNASPGPQPSPFVGLRSKPRFSI